MEMIKHKKGVFFTISAVLLVFVIYLHLQAYGSSAFKEQSFLIEDRIKSVDYFIGDIEKDISRGSYIASFRALLALQQKITADGNYIENLSETYKELLINGTIDGVYMSVMNETELNRWIEKIKKEAALFAITLDYEIVDAALVHKTPWLIETQLSVILNISDNRKTAAWIRNQTINSTLNITLFEDPLYTINTFGRAINIIEKSNITVFVSGQDTANLKHHAENSLYIESSSSPSYLMRIQGILQPSENGIESIVNLRKLEISGIAPEQKSCIDYIYFSEDDPQNWRINNTFNWLRLDNESGHLETYNAESQIIWD